MRRILASFLTPAILTAALASPPAAAADWPQLQCNPQRTGYTPETVKPPFRLAWYRNFQPERVSRCVQAVVYRERVFVGTKSGNVHALGAEDGKQAWKYASGSPILNTAACAEGKVIVACLDGTVHAIGADTGEPVWKFEGEEGCGFSTAPLVADASVLIGQRGGAFHSLGLSDGKLRWRFRAGAPIFNTAACSAGRVFFCDEALHVRCLDAKTGRELWRSERLYGESAAPYHPVVHKGLVMLRTAMTHRSGMYRGRNWNFPSKFGMPTWDKGKSKARRDAYLAALGAGKAMPEELLKEQEKFIQYFKDRPEEQDLFALDEATGRRAFIPPHVHCQTLPLHEQACPPVADGRGGVIIPWHFINFGWARLDLERRRIIEMIVPPRPTNPDETVNVSVGGDLLFIMHCQEGNASYTGVYDMKTKEFHGLPRAPNRWWRLTNNCQSGNNAASIADGFFYHIVFHQLAAWTSAGGGK